MGGMRKRIQSDDTDARERGTATGSWAFHDRVCDNTDLPKHMFRPTVENQTTCTQCMLRPSMTNLPFEHPFPPPRCIIQPINLDDKEGKMKGSKPGRAEFRTKWTKVCACGCGESFEKTGRAQKYKDGHSPAVKSKAKERLCKCGCGQKVAPPARGRSYIEGHSLIEKAKAAAAEKRAARNKASVEKMKNASRETSTRPTRAAKDLAIGVATHALTSLAKAAYKAMVLDMLVAVGTISQEKVDDMLSFVKKHGFVNESKGL